MTPGVGRLGLADGHVRVAAGLVNGHGVQAWLARDDVWLGDRAHAAGQAGSVDPGTDYQQRVRQTLGDPRVAYLVSKPDLVVAYERVGLPDESQDGIEHVLAVGGASRQVLRAERPV